ncbi:MAG: MurR/RpiR family transcriptional regulator [Spirochaetales bacterium]|nr:MurR/RpiR family transcriptional regulator [Spirochaetales bacterium]
MDATNHSLKKILSHYDSLSRLQKRIADYIVANLGEVVFTSVTNLGEILGVSDATIVRFAQELGYSGFPELKDELIKYYKIYLNPAVRIEKYIGDTGGKELTYEAITKREIKHLEESVKTVNENAFKQAVNAICTIDNIYIFGTGSNEPLSTHLAYRLARFSLNISLISVSGRNLFEKLLRVQKDDLMIAFAFYKPSLDFQRLMSITKEKGTKVILITDSHIPNMIKNANIVLYGKRGPFGSFHSPLVPMAVTNALIIGTANKLGERAIESLKQLDEMRKKYYRNNEEILK